MGNKEVEGKRKKKKGRPSLLDIQKRSLRLQKPDQKQFQKPKPSNPNFTNPNPHHHGRITRRNPNPDTIGTDKIGSDNDDDDDDDEEDNGKRQREKKLNLVLRKNPNQKSFSNSQYLDPQLYGSDLDDDDEEPVENAEASQKLKKQKIDGSGYRDGKKGEKHTSGFIGTGTPLESGPTTPLPDKKLLFFILDRLQKKDTYGVFSDPVDPEELPDYHDIIDHPMDFGTVRKKLDTGVYASLEQFEKDVLLISSNAMQYNAPDTIYFRQARSIQELARKNFEELRQDSDDNEPEVKIETKIEPKVVRRGRPPGRPLGRPPGTKNVKKTPGKASFDSTSDATLARGGESSNWSNSYNLRRGPLPNKYSPNDSSRTYHGSRNVENYTRWSAERTSERNADFHGSFMKGFSTKYGKMHVPEENRRDTYMNPSLLVGEPSVLSTFEADQIQLMPVGLHMEHGYARSLARFAADLGPVAWKVAAKKIERALPPGTRFGPGWVGESEAPSQAQTLPTEEPSSPIVEVTSSILASAEPKVDKLAEQESMNNATSDCLSNKMLRPSTMTPHSVAVNRSLELPTYVEADRGVNSNTGFESINCTTGGMSTPFRIHESPALNPVMNGLNGVFGFNNQSQMGKSDRPALSNGSYISEPSIHSRIFDMARNSFVNSMPVNRLESSDNSKLSSNFVMNSCSTSNSGHMVQAGSLAGLNPWRGLPMQQKVDSVPPDLNLRFQSSGSPSSSVRIDSPQPDLALQL